MSAITILKRPLDEGVQVQRKFFRKTAKGKVVKVLRERYLRDDIACGIRGICTSANPSLPSRGDLTHPSFPNGHFILPDTNVFLHQMDLMESDLFNTPIILLQTVMEEVRHRSLPLFNRLKSLTKIDGKAMWIFYNEFNAWVAKICIEYRDLIAYTLAITSETAVVRQGDETPNDRNDRGIRNATAWYNTYIKSHLRVKRGQSFPTVILITDDVENRRRAEMERISCLSVRQYVAGMKSADSLLDIIAAHGEDQIQSTAVSGKRPMLYPEYLPRATLLAGVKHGTFYQGFFAANPYNYLEGTVNVPAFAKPVLLVGRENMNRSVEGDIVAVEVFPEVEWKAPGDEVVDQEAALKNDDADDSEAEHEAGETATREERRLLQREVHERALAERAKEKQPTGRVVGVIKRNWRTYVCHIDRGSLTTDVRTSTAQQSVFATPVERRLPRIRIRTRQAPSLVDQKILVTIDRWDTNSRYPEGHFVRALGRVESKEAETESLLLEFDVPYRPFGRAILDCLPPEGERWIVPAKSDDDPVWRGRADLRGLNVCSIDPPGCQDIDDALHARLLPNGNIEAGVHIADVSHFVPPDTPMDTEAAARGTTVYLVNKRIDMLPSLLGTNLCSLRPNVERLAFSAIWELTPDAEIVGVRFSKSVIASKSAFTYEEAQIRKDDLSLTDDLTNSIRLLNTLAIKLKAARMNAGALNLASPEVKIHLDSPESSDPIDVEQKEQHETNSLVEEFMLLANISVARKIQETFPLTAVLRRHMAPPPTNFEKLQDLLLKLKGFHIDASSSGALAKSLDACVDPSEPTFNTLVRIMATRCMLSAEYFCSGSVSNDTFGHYGLASPIYTHFTSPIRRYADVLAHRQLSAATSYTPLHATLHSQSYVEKVLDVVNRRHRMAQMAGRASVEFYVGLAVKARGQRNGAALDVVEDAFVIRAFRNGLAVFVSTLGLEGLVTFKKEIKFDAEAYNVTIQDRSGREVTISVFDKVRVKITVEKDRNTQRAKVKMILASPIDSLEL